MDSSRKSFKAYSVAQPLKKEIDDILMKVELEKRKFLTCQREETYMRDNLEKKKKQLNELKLKEPQTKTYSSKTWQAGNVINNVDRNYLQIHDNLQQLKSTINIHRKQIFKYKQLNGKLQVQINTLIVKCEGLLTSNQNIENDNEQIKDQIMQLREGNLRNTTQFHKSRMDVNNSHHRNQNQRKKFNMKQKSFLGEEMKNSKMIPFDILSDQLRNSGIKYTDNANEVLTLSLPLAKQRIRNLIRKNVDKLKITEQFKKFGENLKQMFEIMMEYKGRDDIDFIAEQFVTKEKQLQKIQEYIAQLQSRINNAQKTLKKRRLQDQKLSLEVNTKVEKADEKYAALQEEVKQDIQKLKKKEVQFNQWFNKISNIFLPFTEEHLTRSNASNLIGQLQDTLNLQANVKKDDADKKSIGKAQTLPIIDIQQSKQAYNQLLNYQKMREIAAEYVKNKKNGV